MCLNILIQNFGIRSEVDNELLWQVMLSVVDRAERLQFPR